MTLIEAEYNQRLQALEQRLKLLESKVPTHDNVEATKIVQAAAQGNPNFLIGNAMGMIKEEQFDEDNSLRPRMAVADHGKVAAPAENANNVKFEKKQVTTIIITENDNSAGRGAHGSTSGNPNVLVGRQGALSTAEWNRGGERAERKADDEAGEKVKIARAQKAEVKAAGKVEQAAEKKAAAVKKAAEQAAKEKAAERADTHETKADTQSEKQAAAEKTADDKDKNEVEEGKHMNAKGTMVDTTGKAEDKAAEKAAEIARAQKVAVKADEDAVAAGKIAEKVEQAAKKQAAAIKKADKHAAAAKKAAERAAKKKAAADEKTDAKIKKRADADEAKAHKQSEKQAAAEKKAVDAKDEATAKCWQIMDEECALGMVHALSWSLTGSQDVLFLLGSPFRHWIQVQLDSVPQNWHEQRGCCGCHNGR